MSTQAQRLKVETFKRHVLWLERDRTLADPITGTMVKIPSGCVEGGSCFTHREHRFYFLRQPLGTWVNWELTFACPQRCEHCFQPIACCRKPVSLDASKWQSIAAAVTGWAPEEISLTGGDPALVCELPEILGYLRHLLPRARLRLLTTGPGMLSRKDLHELLDQCSRDQVTLHLTLLGPTGERHDCVANRDGAFRELEELLTVARASGVDVELRVHLFRGPLSAWIATAELAETLAPGKWYATSLLYPPRHLTADHKWRFRVPSIATLRQALAEELFAPLAVEYVSFEPLCAGGCQVISVDPRARISGCDVAAIARPAVRATPSLNGRAEAKRWRETHRRPDKCTGCRWRDWCRFCPVASVALGEYFCRAVDLAARHVLRRFREYLSAGLEPIWPEMRALRLLASP